MFEHESRCLTRDSLCLCRIRIKPNNSNARCAIRRPTLHELSLQRRGVLSDVDERALDGALRGFGAAARFFGCGFAWL